MASLRLDDEAAILVIGPEDAQFTIGKMLHGVLRRLKQGWRNRRSEWRPVALPIGGDAGHDETTLAARVSPIGGGVAFVLLDSSSVGNVKVNRIHGDFRVKRSNRGKETWQLRDKLPCSGKPLRSGRLLAEPT